MSNYLMDKFRGKYRIKCPITLDGNLFPVKLNGTYEDIDVYIDCAQNVKVFYYGHGVLEAYIPSLQKGHNILKSIASEVANLNLDDFKESEIFNYEKLYSNKEFSKIISYIEETDSEVLFRFKHTYMELFEKYLKPKTSGANISPFSSKNLPKSDYKIPDDQLESYKNIIENIPQNQRIALVHMTNKFIKTLTTKSKPIENIKVEMKQKGLKPKEYIHSIGKWNSYVSFLENELKGE